MNERIRRLRHESVSTKPYIDTERAELLTQFYRDNENHRYSTPVFRALAFKHILKKKTISISDGELIVGERGKAPKATPTFPELCCHSISDLDVMDGRERTPFRADQAAKNVYSEEIIPFWKGKSIREKLFEAMEPQWHTAFEAGVFTEFMEQRSPGHAVLDDKIYRTGLNGFKARMKAKLDSLDFHNDMEAYGKQ